MHDLCSLLQRTYYPLHVAPLAVYQRTPMSLLRSV